MLCQAPVNVKISDKVREVSQDFFNTPHTISRKPPSPGGFLFRVNGYDIFGLMRMFYNSNLGSHDADPTWHMQRCKAIVYDGSQFGQKPLSSKVTQSSLYRVVEQLENIEVYRAGECIRGWRDYSMRWGVNEFYQITTPSDQEPPKVQLKLAGVPVERVDDRGLISLPEHKLLPPVRPKDIARAIDFVLAGIVEEL